MELHQNGFVGDMHVGDFSELQNMEIGSVWAANHAVILDRG
jgi:hypothetical protein